ncbi:DUF6114 domain-containing protein [Corynebacterium frankenforstense]|uniref:DUF6114 domain-containing protein n=3 Tax=Corynebacterium frankenforstense TaxID=1230998 RepID=UPI00254F48C2|nr:DUF6114 domain-containing protein [Corynebacterium frankenforstense]MDK6260071.1 DUF6114 domain-containing protein [Corynebacterium frankenforstense]
MADARRTRTGRLIREEKPAARAEEAEPESGLEEANRGFGAWPRQRPFTAGLLMILAGVVIMVPAYLSFEVSNIQVQISSMSGVSTLVIGALLIICGLMTWFRGDGRILTGVTALILGVVALPASNFGGFILGTLLAIVGGAMALSWSPGERPSKRGAGAGTGAGAAAVAAVAAVGLVAGSPSPAARAQLPAIPEVPEVPEVLEIPAPQIPAVPAPELPAPPEVPSDIRELVPEVPEIPGVPAPHAPAPEIPGLDTAPPEPIAGMPPLPGTTYTVRSDSTRLLGDVKLSYVTVDTVQGPRPAIRIDADRVVLDNLNVRFPAQTAGTTAVWQRTGPGQITTLNGDFHIIVASLEVTPQLAG